MTAINKQPTRHEIEELLPWYATGTLADTCSAAKVPHSITSSAATCSVIGIERPSAFAVLRLITSSNRLYPIGVAQAPLKIDLNIAADGPVELLKSLPNAVARSCPCNRSRDRASAADPSHPFGLLRCNRPSCRATEQRYDLAPGSALSLSSLRSFCRCSSQEGSERKCAPWVSTLATSSLARGA